MVRRLLPIALALIFANIALPCDAQERGYIGVDLRDLTAERARELRLDPTGGVLIVNPRPNSPAQQAGLAAGDVILALDDMPVRNMARAVDYIGARAPGTRLKISIWRGGERRELTSRRDYDEEACDFRGCGRRSRPGSVSRLRSVSMLADSTYLTSCACASSTDTEKLPPVRSRLNACPARHWSGA
jgi:PDZ domain